jgi:Ca2+-binding EF-hand superfamily protein
MTISSVGSSSLLQQLLQARAATSTQAATTDSTSTDPFALIGQNLPSGGKNAPPPPMQGWSSSGQGFSSDTLASLLSSQQTDQSDRAASMFADADADGDGAVTSDELATAMAAHAPADRPSDAPSATDMASHMLSSGDSDGDGSLSLSEFQAMKPQGGTGGPHGAGGPPPGPPPSGGSDDSGSSSSASTDPADLNGDGVVSAAELAQTLTSAADSLGSEISSDASDLMQKLLTQLTSNLANATSSTTASVDVAA